MPDTWSIPGLSLTNEPIFCLMFYHLKVPLHQNFRLISVPTEQFEFTLSASVVSVSLPLFLSHTPFFLSGYSFT